MSDHGPAQLELIRRYARTLREMHADAMAARPSRADREGRIRPAGEPIRQAAQAMAERSRDASGPPTLPAA
jgi:hypothetical protein